MMLIFGIMIGVVIGFLISEALHGWADGKK